MKKAMTIDIHQPEIEALILQRLESGEFQDVEDVLLHALRASETPARTGQELIDACAKVSGILTDEEIDTLFSRNPSGSRPVDFE
jgi:hypothetical protein